VFIAVPLCSIIYDFSFYRDDELSYIYMIPLPNFTTYKYKSSKPKSNSIKSNIWYFIRNILFPINYKKLKKDEKFSSFLQIIHNIEYKNPFFEIPAMEAVMTSRWKTTKNYWMISLFLYFLYLVLFSYLSWFYLKNNEIINKVTKVTNVILIILFYYIGIYLFLIEYIQMREYKFAYLTGHQRVKKYNSVNKFSIFNIFNLFNIYSIFSGIITLTFILTKSYTKSNSINFIDNDTNEDFLIILSSFTILFLWIELVTF